MESTQKQMEAILRDSLHYNFDEEACRSALDIEKTAANLLASGILLPFAGNHTKELVAQQAKELNRRDEIIKDQEAEIERLKRGLRNRGLTEITLRFENILEPNKQGSGVVVCRQVNCRGRIGTNLDREVKKMHPHVQAAYREKCREIKAGIGGLGDVQYCSVPDDFGYVVANIFGQDDCGREQKRYTDYDALHKAFTHIAQAFPNDTIRIPYNMGCGFGGGDWPTVVEIVIETLVSKGITVEFWEYPNG